MASSSTLLRTSARALARTAQSPPGLYSSRALATTSTAAAQAGEANVSSAASSAAQEKVRVAAPIDPSIKKQQEGSPSSATPLSPSPPPPRAHNALTVGLVKGIARLLGYNTTSSMAIRVTSEMYDLCAAQAELQADFFYGACQLPPTYQTWFQITTLHIHLLLTRFRALETPAKANAYSQELINHFFIDAESRMRLRFGVQTSRLVKGYMKEMHAQQRGAILGLDEALSYSVARDTDRERFGDADAALATALWRNLWGAGGWGRGVGGVKRKVKGIDAESEAEKKMREAAEKEGRKLDDDNGKPDLARDVGASTAGRGEQHVAAAIAAQRQGQPTLESLEHNDQTPGSDLDFALALQRLVQYYRRETVRLANLSNGDIEKGRIGRLEGNTMQERMDGLKALPRVADFSRV